MKCKSIFAGVSILSILIVIWFGFPLISISGQHPFQSSFSRVMAIMLFFLSLFAFFICKRYVSEYLDKKMISAFIKGQGAKTSINLAPTEQELRAILNSLRQIYKQQGKNYFRFRDLPWFMVLGNSNSGKTAAILNSDHIFPQVSYTDPVSFLDPMSKPSFTWWLGEDRVFFAFNTDTLDKGFFHSALNVLRKYRRSRPLNGVVLACPLITLITDPKEKQQSFIRQLKVILEDLQKYLRSSFPIYLLLTKCDQVLGFEEFFRDLPLSEKEQPWGIEFKEGISAPYYGQSFSVQFRQAIEKLQEIVPHRLSQAKTQEERNRIFCFPTQIQLFLMPIYSFLMEGFDRPSYVNEVQLQGVYFSSAMQDGNAFDLCGIVCNKQLGAEIPHKILQSGKKQSFFLKKFLSDVLLSHAFLTNSPRRTFLLLCLRRIIYVGMISLFLINVAGIYADYNFNKDRIYSIEERLKIFKKKLQSLPRSPHVAEVSSLLKPLQQAIDNYQQSKHNWVIHFQPYQPLQIERTLNQMLTQELQDIFLPSIRDRLAELIIDNQKEPKKMESLLKAYLMLGNPPRMDKTLITRIMYEDWDKAFSHQIVIKNWSRFFLKRALEQPKALPLDLGFIKKIQQMIDLENVAIRAYSAIKMRALQDYSMPFIPQNQIGPEFNLIFNTLQDDEFPMLYTVIGFKEIMNKQALPIIRAILLEDEQIGLAHNEDSSIPNDTKWLEELHTLYSRDYIQYWSSFLNSIDISNPYSLEEHVKILKIISGRKSPLLGLLNLFRFHTDFKGIPSNIKEEFQSINEISETVQGVTSEITAILGALANLHDYCKELIESPEKSISLFKAAQEHFLNRGKSDPISKLENLSEDLPEPIKTWLESLTSHTWDLISEGAQNHVQQVWEETILKDLEKECLKKFPFDPQSQQDMSLETFTKFFGPQGLLDQFFNEYLRPFIIKTNNRLHWKERKPQNLNFPEDFLNFFQHVYEIQEIYFPNKSSTPAINFTILPWSLSPNAASVKLKLGDKTLEYRHEAPQSYSFTWPQDFKNKECKIEFNDFNNSQYEISTFGDWSLLRLLQRAEFLRISPENKRYYQLKHKDFAAIIEFSCLQNSDIFELGQFQKIKSIIPRGKPTGYD